MVTPGLTVVTGGARAGKTAFALQLARAHVGPVIYVATAEAGDDEMAVRIQRHRAERPRHWRTIEEPVDPLAALASVLPGTLVVLDCVTLWVSNLLLAALPRAAWDTTEGETAAQRALTAVREFAAWCERRQVSVVAVTNEVGLGIVPADPLTRLYRDTLGHANRLLAAHAERVYLAVAGLALELRTAGAVAVNG